MQEKRPLIGIPADRRVLGPQPYHLVGEKYLTAILDAAGGLPVIVPAIGRELAMDDLLGTVDGLLFMGSPSNVEPHRYGGPACVLVRRRRAVLTSSRTATGVSRAPRARCMIRTATTRRCR